MSTESLQTELAPATSRLSTKDANPAIPSGNQEMEQVNDPGLTSEQIEPGNPEARVSDSDFDLDSIRLTQHFGEQINVKKMLTTVPVRKPNKTQFFRTHPGHRMEVMLLKYDETDEQYVVKPQVVSEVLQLAKPCRLVLVVDRLGTAFIWPLALPDEERPMDWHKSALEADYEAQSSWVRMAANQALGAYEIFKAAGELSEPIWPTESWNKLVEVAFKQKIIDTPEHVIIQKLQGVM